MYAENNEKNHRFGYPRNPLRALFFETKIKTVFYIYVNLYLLLLVRFFFVQHRVLFN